MEALSNSTCHSNDSIMINDYNNNTLNTTSSGGIKYVGFHNYYFKLLKLT